MSEDDLQTILARQRGLGSASVGKWQQYEAALRAKYGLEGPPASDDADDGDTDARADDGE
jgi:hypothetical protein